jgi:hypothetical protein
VAAVFALRGNRWATEGLQRIARMTDFSEVFARHSEQALFALISEVPTSASTRSRSCGT